MDIRQRITILVVSTFVAIASIGGYATYQSRGNANQVKLVTEGVVPSALASADLVSQLKDVQLATMNLVSAPDANLVSQIKTRLTGQKAKLQSSLELQQQQADSDTQRGLVQQAKESLHNYFSAVDDTANFKVAGQNELAAATLFAGVAQYQTELEQIIDTLRIEKTRSKDAAIASLNSRLASTVSALSVVTVLAIVVLSAIGFMLYRQIIRPIGRMQSMMSEIATSQDFTRRVPVERADEIGRSTEAFNAMLAKIQESSAQLKQKTTDIQAMLQNMPQGILTVVAGSRIHHEYSAYLETILETNDVPNRDVMALIFSDTHLGADVLSQVEAAIGSCIGEDAMNFDFNAHLLVGEVEKRMPDGRVKILDLNWSPITDDNDTVVRLMLCVRDVTELRKLALEANEQKHELEMIGEILAVSQEKFHEFIVSALTFIDENEIVLHRHIEPDADALAQLFRNMHTIKGNARTYGLQHLTNVVHEAEQTYEALRKPRPDIAWDQDSLLAELAGVRAAVERYSHINEVSLGRRGPGRRGVTERYLLVDKGEILETLHRLETVNTGNLHELVAARDAVRKTLRLLGTEPIAATLGAVLDAVPALAAELGKATPSIRIDDNGYVIRNQASGLLKNVFMHLVRNAVDHGLEAADVRTAAGKAANGLLRISLAVADGTLQVALWDDGRGLALLRIRAIAVERGLVSVDEPLSDDEIANLIFRPGFSTAERVTDISGRGVGMDAVQDFVRREGGKIAIRFTDDAVGANFRQFKTVISLPDSYAIQVDDNQLEHLRDASAHAEAQPLSQRGEVSTL
ncbi:HAMP domain-containing protein [Andreprevotia chitinilytica]|uniref:HAMP domain-containing protein n=1 Tax=Andreprevotia chitinilytica TaxID=396808 RepID=UPI00055073C5|nr:HAMP domain-containing protein [Andreprevotia chitinilytica]